jgi:hypothetical protein
LAWLTGHSPMVSIKVWSQRYISSSEKAGDDSPDSVQMQR